jgi:hypothetical protein
VCSERQLEPDREALAVTLGADDAAVRGNELLDYCQTDAGAAAATRATAIRPVEAFENVRE